MARTFILAVVLLVTGCATADLPPVEPPKAIALAQGSNTATIYLTRENGGALGHSSAEIMLDGKKTGTITNGQCVRLTIPAGSHNLQLAKSVFASLGSALGNAVASAFKIYNVKIKSGETQFFRAKARYDGPKTGWLFTTTKQKTGSAC